MGTRVITEAARLGLRGDYLPGQPLRSSGARLKQPLSGNFKMQVIYDGTAGKEGLPPELLATEAWLDASGLFRVGLNVGPTLHNISECSCVITGCNLPRDYAYKVDAAKVAEASSLWVAVATLAKGQVHSLNTQFALLRFVFTASGSNGGCIALQSW